MRHPPAQWTLSPVEPAAEEEHPIRAAIVAIYEPQKPWGSIGGRRVGTCQVIVQVPHCFLVFFFMCFLLLLNLGHIHTLGKAREARDED